MTAQPYPIAPWPSYSSEGWLLDEERALRDWMKGMLVSDYESGGQTRSVEAWFGHPDQELREQKYPYVTIDLLQIQEAKERVHRGNYYVNDVPDWWGLTPLAANRVAYLLEMPTPIDLDYQVATWARNPRHDRQILQQMITGGRTMLRGGMLHVGDGTRRRLDVLTHYKRDTVDANGKRLHNNVFRVRISSEVPWGVIAAGKGYTLVKSVLINQNVAENIPPVNLVGGTVVAWYPNAVRTADINVEGVTLRNVPVSRYFLGEPGENDLVSLIRTPQVEEPAAPTDYHYVVLSLKGGEDS